MSVVRRFLVAPALVRLIRKERGGARITEGYFAPQGGRTSFVRVDGQQCHLVLITKDAQGVSTEEHTDVPRTHGDALLDVCSGKAAYDRTAVTLGGCEALIDRYVSPGSLDLISVAFDAPDDAAGFAVPVWFGREVSDDAAYERQALALQGMPQTGKIGLGNAALDAVLDLIEPRFGSFGRFGGTPRPSEPKPEKIPEKASEKIPEKAPEDDGVVDALRKSAGNGAPAPVAAAAVVAAPAPAAAPTTPEPVAPEPDAPGPAAAEVPQDARIDDVIASLSQALGAAIQQPQPPAAEAGDIDPASTFERWTVRPRRTQQT